MRVLDECAIRDIARGSAILASGGGGDPYLGTLAALHAANTHGFPTLLDPDELASDDIVACTALFGAPLPFVEKLTFGTEVGYAYQRMTRLLGTPMRAFMPIEAGGVNMMIPFLMGSTVGMPIVDADLMGRAFPELALVTPSIYEMAVNPTVIADENGNTVVVDAINNAWADRLCRAAAIEFGATAGECTAPMSGDDVREVAVLNSVSQAERIGAAIRRAQEAKSNPIDALVEEAGGFKTFEGKIIDVERETRSSSTCGVVTIGGLGADVGETLKVHFRNENLIAEVVDGPVLATVPDIITIVDADTGQAITTERLRYGYRVAVVAIPVNDKWRSERGLELAGPHHFGFSHEFVPVERLAADRLKA